VQQRASQHRDRRGDVQLDQLDQLDRVDELDHLELVEFYDHLERIQHLRLRPEHVRQLHLRSLITSRRGS
jgi:hypothetical protein